MSTLLLLFVSPPAHAACEFTGAPAAFVHCIDDLAQEAWDTAMANLDALDVIRDELATLAGPGRTPATAQSSCREILELDPHAASGRYWVAPEEAPFQVYCDMTSDGGGWTLVSQGRPVLDLGSSLCNTGAVNTLDLDDETVTVPAKLADVTITALWAGSPEREVMQKQEAENWDQTEHQWSEVVVLDFVDDHAWTSESAASLDWLESMDVRTLRGSYAAPLSLEWSAGVFSCGYAFYTTESEYVIYTSTGAYAGGTCGDAIAGRSWTKAPNSGCNTSKVYVR